METKHPLELETDYLLTQEIESYRRTMAKREAEVKNLYLEIIHSKDSTIKRIRETQLHLYMEDLKADIMHSIFFFVPQITVGTAHLFKQEMEWYKQIMAIQNAKKKNLLLKTTHSKAANDAFPPVRTYMEDLKTEDEHLILELGKTLRTLDININKNDTIYKRSLQTHALKMNTTQPVRELNLYGMQVFVIVSCIIFSFLCISMILYDIEHCKCGNKPFQMLKKI